MRRLLTCLAIVFTSSFALAAPNPKTDPPVKNETGIEHIRKMLDSKVSLDYTGSNLPTVVAHMSEEYRINFVLDKATIQQMGVEPNELMVEAKLKDVKLRGGLRTMLGQFSLTFAIVGDTVLITTEEQAIYKQLKHRISVDCDSVPLNKALKDLAHANGINVVIDPRTFKNKSAESLVTLAVEDVPFEAVVRLMCEMAGLKPARMGNVIFVTTEDRANKLKDSDSLVPNPGLPGVGAGVGNPGLLLPGGIGGVGPIPAPAFEKQVPENKN
ncbi:MAG: hypothetical protein K8T89_04075 [Planctomycetes bacterium]|nr:hypothetical protein [Planctomycetota bacterium]